MIVKTLFQHEGQLKVGEVEVKLLPGIPQLHIVGQPDAHIRECGIKLKSALRSANLEWPQGHQIVVNLRPPHFRKSGSGVELAVALGFLALTHQLPEAVQNRLATSVVYGELALDGRVFAPYDLSFALRSAGMDVISGEPTTRVREGEWWQLRRLDQAELDRIKENFSWDEHWRAPEFPDIEFHPEAAEALWLTAHMNLNVLLAGPQGTGKSTWAKALYSLTPRPTPRAMAELLDLFGEEILARGWRPFESPHHSITPLAMIGGGSPIFPGVITRAHGGILVMDEFLEFGSSVLEALREPIESGIIEHARRGERVRYPADFQLVATTNLCPCGKLNPDPKVPSACKHSITRCRSVCARLSGPVMDRFDVVIMSHKWLKKDGPGRRFSEVRALLAETRAFAQMRRDVKNFSPPWTQEFELNHRRRNSLLRVARALADREGQRLIQDEHFHQAYQYVESPMAHIRQLFA